jgi:UDP-N-acetylglucosamine/UDP-N-acetylgalactosamine diphosphorylase
MMLRKDFLVVTAVATSESAVSFLDPRTVDRTGRIDFGEIVYAHLSARLRGFGQEHLLQFWHELTVQEQESLAAEILSVDFEQIRQLHQNFLNPEAVEAVDISRVQEPQSVKPGESTRFSQEAARAVGEAALQTGLVGVVIVTGGQGSRLGFEHPKGMYPIGPVSNATLFQILIEKICATSDQNGVRIPLYRMTSPATHEETVEFLESNDRFVLSEEDLHVFCQGTMPAVDMQTGRLVLKEKNGLFFSPNGHGGMLEALDTSGCPADMQQRGVEHLFYCQIDNALVELIRPEFIGYHILSNSELTTQVIRKQLPSEKVGNVVSVDGKAQMIEYSDLPEELAAARNDDDSLKVWAGNIAVHAFSVSFLERIASQPDRRPAVPLCSEESSVLRRSWLGRQTERTERGQVRAIHIRPDAPRPASPCRRSQP